MFEQITRFAIEKGRKHRSTRRLIALALAASLTISMTNGVAFAAEGDSTGANAAIGTSSVESEQEEMTDPMGSVTEGEPPSVNEPDCTCPPVEGGEAVHSEGCPLYTASDCTCPPVESGEAVHREGCPLYTASDCTCPPVEGGEAVHREGCPLYIAPDAPPPAEKCACTVLCTEDAVNGECPLCVENWESCVPVAAEPSEAAKAAELLAALPMADELPDPDSEGFAAYLEALWADVLAARAAYDALTEEEKAAIDPAAPEKLTALEEALAAMPVALAAEEIPELDTNDLYQGVTYKLNSPNSGEATVYSSYSAAGVGGVLTIPAQVQKGGATYDVTAISDNAFYDKKATVEITVPASVASIKEAAFCGIASGAVVTLKHTADDPLTLDDLAFQANSLRPLYVVVQDDTVAEKIAQSYKDPRYIYGMIVRAAPSSPSFENQNSQGTLKASTPYTSELAFGCYDVNGLERDTPIITTYQSGGYYSYLSIADSPAHGTSKAVRLPGAGVESYVTNGVWAEVDTDFVSGENYLRVTYTLRNKTDTEITKVSLGVNADVKIGVDDKASIHPTPTGFRMVNTKSSGAGSGMQFTLNCKNAPGADDVTTMWYGLESDRSDNLFADLADKTELTGCDSGLAFSWQGMTIPANGEITRSVLFGVGEDAAPPALPDPAEKPIALYLTTSGQKDITVNAKVTDTAGVTDTLYYTINGGAEQALGETVTADGSEQVIAGVIGAENFAADGDYTIKLWVMNFKGAMSEVITKTLTVSGTTIGGGLEEGTAPVEPGGTTPPVTAITIKVNDGAEVGGADLQAAVTASGVALGSVAKLEITAGEVTTADWTWFAGGGTPALSGLTEFTVDSAVTSVADIPDLSPKNFPATIETVRIPQAIKIGTYAFSNCKRLTTASVPKATSIGDSAFYGCKALKNADFPVATSIGTSAFDGCEALTSANLSKAASIGSSGFNFCTALKTASFPAVTSIGDSAFFTCNALATLELGAAPPRVANNNTFSGCPNIRSLAFVDTDGNALTDTALTTAQAAYKAIVDGNTADDLWYGWTIGGGTTPPVTAITIKVNDGAEVGGATLEAAVAASGAVLTDITKLEITAGKVTDNDWKWFAGGGTPALSELTEFKIAEGIAEYNVAGIPDLSDGRTFPTSIETVTIPQMLQIGENAFKGCAQLTTATFPKAWKIGGSAFKGCTQLTSASFPKVANAIGANAFKDCLGLTNVNFPEATTISSGAFQNCNALTSVTSAAFPKARFIQSSAFSFCNHLESVNFPEATSIGGNAFKGCQVLTSVNFPKATSIGSAFMDCTALTSVNFPVAGAIESAAFQNCAAMTSVAFPKVINIGENAFNGCTALATLKFGATPPYVSMSGAFSGCPATRGLALVGADGSALTGTALTTAQAAYKAVDDGNTADDLWYGWAIAGGTPPNPEAGWQITGGASGSGTVAEAFTAMQGKTGVITLLRDMENPTIGTYDETVLTSGSVTLNINGKTVQNIAVGVLGGTLTVQDSAGGGKLTPPNTSEYPLLICGAGGKLKVESGSFVSGNQGNLGTLYVPSGFPQPVVELSGGTFTGKTAAINVIAPEGFGWSGILAPGKALSPDTMTKVATGMEIGGVTYYTYSSAATVTVKDTGAPTPPTIGGDLTDPLTQGKVDDVFGPGNATLDNTTSPPTITIGKDIVVDEAIVIKAPIKVEIDLGGNTITGKPGVSPIIIIEGGADVSITGPGSVGGVEGVDRPGGAGGSGGDGIKNDGELTIKDGAAISGGGGGSGATGGAGGSGITGDGNVNIGAGGSSTGGGGGGGSSGNGGNGGNGTGGGTVTVDGGGSSTGGAGGSGSATGGNGGNGTSGDSTTINGGTTGGSGGSGASGSNGNGGNGGDGANQGSGTVDGSGTATGGNGGSGAGTGTGGNGGQGVGGGARPGDDLNVKDGIGARVEVVGDAGGKVKLPNEAETVDAVLTDDEKADKKITDVTVTLKVDDKTATKPDQAAVESKKPANSVVGAFFDITMKKTITKTDGSSITTDTTDVTVTPNNKQITITIEIPADMRGGSDYVVIRVHTTGGTTTTTLLNDTDADPNTITFETNQFSTYAIAYTPSGTTPPTPSNPGGSGGSDGSSSDYDQYDFWMTVKDEIQRADSGDVIKVNAKGYDKMPWSVMAALRKNDGVSLVITWSGKTITIPAGKAQKNEPGRIYWPLSLLAELYAGITEDTILKLDTQNPETDGPGKYIPVTGGGELITLEAPAPAAENTLPGGADNAQTIAPAQPKPVTPPDAGFEADAFAGTPDNPPKKSTTPWMGMVLLLGAAAVAGGIWFWKRKAQTENQ